MNTFDILDTPIEERYDRICRLAMAYFDVPFAAIVFVDQDRQWAKSSPGFGQWQTDRDISYCAHAILGNEPYVVEDSLLDDKVADLAAAPGFEKFRFYAGVPVRTNDGFHIGTLCIADFIPRQLTRNIQSLVDLASIVESELYANNQNQILKELTASKKELQFISQQLTVNDRLNTLRNLTLELVAQGKALSEVLVSIIYGVEEQFPEMICSILQLDDSGKNFCKGIAPSLPDFYNQALDGLQIGHGVGSCGTAAFQQQRVVVEDIFTHPYWAPFTELAKLADLGACWSEPIVSASGKVLGTFAIYHRVKTTPSIIEFRLIEQSAYLASIAIERELANQLIWRQANYDPLTQLPNRELCSGHINNAIAIAKRNKHKVAVMFIDLDHFKEVNDTLGHYMGDILLIESAKRIQGCVRESDSVARLGGDEFVVVLAGVEHTDAIERVVRSILKEVAKPYTLKQDTAYISASIGISLFPDDGESIDELMKNADQAMYRAKAQGRDCHQYFTPSMLVAARDRMSLINDLRQAISNDELVVHYQPIIDISSGKVVKAEALIRWQHPKRGLVQPLEFIALAEETGLIISIGEWVIEQAIAQAAKWKKRLGYRFKICVNTSPLQYINKNEQSLRWIDMLTSDAVDQQSIILEITENILMDTQTDIMDTLATLRGKGIEMAIDDFGTGYSSLSYLQKFNMDYLKIDRQFVSSMTQEGDDFILCETMVVMAKKLGIKVVAEGIENKEQLDFLRQMGCDLGQGFYIAKPLTDTAFEQTFF
ncbi:MAG: EAL domain-containing protein [Psychrobium sp.]|nr:EAL domain-containing protein [Psychrobium sp.]